MKESHVGGLHARTELELDFTRVMNVACLILFVTRSYLALVASLACEADFCFIPEWPPEIGWPDVLCKKLKQVSQILDQI